MWRSGRWEIDQSSLPWGQGFSYCSLIWTTSESGHSASVLCFTPGGKALWSALARTLLVLIFWDRASRNLDQPQTYYVVQHSLELLILLPSMPKCCNYKRALLCLVLLSPGNPTQGIVCATKYFINWATSLAPCTDASCPVSQRRRLRYKGCISVRRSGGLERDQSFLPWGQDFSYRLWSGPLQTADTPPLLCLYKCLEYCSPVLAAQQSPRGPSLTLRESDLICLRFWFNLARVSV